ncbi:MAG: hypothetical protein GX221_10995 [Candidatus Riflebacteria bacterium]|nr:hypothetical protein [Candidatus Riflebacteria bacterium]
MAEADARKAIEGAISYAYEQLGKPYDYGFTDSDGDKAFYCSELVYKAYKSTGLNVAAKNPQRDSIVTALQAVVDSLQPRDRFTLANEIMSFANEYTANPDFDKLQKFLVYTVVPNCGVFAKAFPDKKAYDRLNRTIDLLKNDKAMVNYKKAQQQYNEERDAGKYKTGFGIGIAREKAAQLRIGTAVFQDIDKLAKTAGVQKRELVKIVFQLFLPVYQHMGSVGDLLGGMARQQNMQLPSGIKTLMEIVDWLNARRTVVADWPVIGGLLASIMPGSAEGKVTDDFTSPMDLAAVSNDKIIYDWPK